MRSTDILCSKTKPEANMWVIIFFFLFSGTSAQMVIQSGDKCSRSYECPEPYLRINQNCYFFSKNKTNWQSAFFTCQDFRGKLAIIRNAHQDDVIKGFLNKVALVNEERWIGGMYDWEQMTWKWGASGKPIEYKGFARMEPDDKERLKWHCVVLDPYLEYKWNIRICSEEKYFICQTKLRKVVGKKRLHYDDYTSPNEIPLPGSPGSNKTNLKEHRPNGHLLPSANEIPEPDAFAHRNDTVVEKRGKRRRKNRRKDCDQYTGNDGNVYNRPQVKYGRRQRRNKSKEEEVKKEKNTQFENIHTQIYYGATPKSPLHPRVITEELTFP